MLYYFFKFLLINIDLNTHLYFKLQPFIIQYLNEEVEEKYCNLIDEISYRKIIDEDCNLKLNNRIQNGNSKQNPQQSQSKQAARKAIAIISSSGCDNISSIEEFAQSKDFPTSKITAIAISTPVIKEYKLKL